MDKLSVRGGMFMNRILLMVLRNWWRVPGLYGKLCKYARHPERYPEAEMYAHIQHILKLAVGSGNVDLRAYGTENIPAESGFMLYGNHQGLFDVLAVAATCDKPLGAVLKKELYNVPFIHQIIMCTKSFAMDREDVRQSMTVINSVIKEVKAGRNYIIFPEGTRSRKGNEMLEFHHGSFRCATKSKCPVVPVAFIDSFKPLDEKGCKPLTVQIHYLEPIYYDEYKDMNTAELAELVRSRIADTISRNIQAQPAEQ